MKIKLPFGLGRLRYMNWTLFFSMAVLLAIGVLYVYSANAFRESARLRSLWVGHMHMAIVSALLSFVLGLADYRKILSFSWLFYAGAVFLLVAVVFAGTEQMGAKRWVFGIQPSEFAKIAAIAAVSAYLGRIGSLRDIWDFGFVLLLVLVPVMLVFLQPDLGTAIVFLPVTASLLYVSGTALRVLGIFMLVGVLAVSTVLGSIAVEGDPSSPPHLRKAASLATSFLGEYQKGRLADFVYPDRDPLGKGWNRKQSQIAVGSGGAYGKGFLKGDQNILGYLPQQVSANDFIFSVLAEEKGFAGALFLLVCYGILLLSVLATGAGAPDESGRLLCVGVATLVFCHLFVNIGMTVGLIPVTGLPLPFVSYGRTFMAATGIAMGLVQSVAVHSALQRKVQNNDEL